MNRNKKQAAQVFGGFLAVMVLGTVISRAASSAKSRTGEVILFLRGKGNGGSG